MRRAFVLVLAAAATLLAVAPTLAPTAAASAPRGRRLQPNPSVQIDFGARAGLSYYLESRGDKVRLVVSRRHQEVSYEVEGEVTESGIEAKFGRLGEIDMEFEPERPSTTLPPASCESENEFEGTFRGSFDFTGEDGYARLDVSEAVGTLETIPASECADRAASSRVGRAPAPALRRTPRQPNRIALQAYEPPHLFFFVVQMHRRQGDEFDFYGGRKDVREKVTIVHMTIAAAGTQAFAFDPGSGTVVVHPPRPFSGSARYARPPRGKPSWRGSLGVSLLGAPPVHLAGPGFGTKLAHNLTVQ